ncbi:hypothetical protein ACIBH1_44835 [Nonomuraea sp. NPDC050663]|uniref:hypothetical protein n=1 Tax=Nonomuraea sp. NPDC050663 TaxID=3364370 RepID=UPI0037AEDFA7
MAKEGKVALDDGRTVHVQVTEIGDLVITVEDPIYPDMPYVVSTLEQAKIVLSPGQQGSSAGANFPTDRQKRLSKLRPRRV